MYNNYNMNTETTFKPRQQQNRFLNINNEKSKLYIVMHK